jgi:hypothetical protein
LSFYFGLLDDKIQALPLFSPDLRQRVCENSAAVQPQQDTGKAMACATLAFEVQVNSRRETSCGPSGAELRRQAGKSSGVSKPIESTDRVIGAEEIIHP